MKRKSQNGVSKPKVYSAALEPTSVKDALPQEQWKAAMTDDEYYTLLRNATVQRRFSHSFCSFMVHLLLRIWGLHFISLVFWLSSFGSDLVTNPQLYKSIVGAL